MLYKVTANTELANTESFLTEEIQSYIPVSLWTMFSSIDEYIPYFIYISL